MTLHYNFHRNSKGIGTVFGMVFFLLIVMVVFSSFVIVLNQNTSLEQVTVNAKQLDLDRYTELTTVSITNPQVAVLNSVVYISCTITNTGTLPTELVRLWIKDNNTDTVGNKIISPSIILQPGSSFHYFNFINIANAGLFDQLSFWFISTRGNTISAFPDTNQINGITPVGTFPGVTSMNSTYQTNQYNPLQLSLNTNKANQLIYVVVSFDDGNTLYTPTSTPTLTWIARGTSLPTDGSRSSPTSGHSGDSILKTFYAIKPSIGPITINIQSTADELSDYYCSALAFSINDVNTASPFDGSAQTTIGRSVMPHDTINTHFSNELIIGALGIDDLNPAITPAASFGQIMPVQSSYGATGADNAMPRSVWSEWVILDDPTNNLPVNCTFPFNEDWAIIVDAVKLAVVTPPAPVTLFPTRGPSGQLVTVSGQGFAANSQLLATFDGLQVPFSVTTDGSGNIPSGATLTVPQGSTSGIKTVSIIDSKFNYASANFTVTTSSITVTPQTGSAGTTVTVTGSNFIANSLITVNFDGTPMTTNPSTINADPTGGFSASFSTSSAAAGIRQVLVSDGVNSPFANFNVTPSVTLTPNRGLNGALVTISGQGFAANSNLVVTFGGATISPANAVTDSIGSFSNAVFTAQSPTVGAKIVNVTDASGNSAVYTFNLVALDHFTVTGCPSSVTAGQSFGGNNVVVTACDASGFTINAYLGQIYFSSSDTQALLPYTFTNTYQFLMGDNGVHTFAGNSFTLKTAGSQIITATDGIKSGSATGITVNSGPAVSLAVTGYPSTSPAGTVGSVTVTAKDAYGNTATSYRGTVHFTSSDAQAVLPANYAFLAGDNGVHTFTNVALKTVGTQSITAIDTATSSITGTQSGITVTAAG